MYCTGTVLYSTVHDCILLYFTVMALSCEVPELKCTLTTILSQVINALYVCNYTPCCVEFPEPVEGLIPKYLFLEQYS